MAKPSTCANCREKSYPCLITRLNTGDNPADIIVVGLHPSQESMLKGEGFRGRHGQLFKKMLNKATIQRRQTIKVNYTYAARVSAVKPNKAVITSCRPLLYHSIRVVRGTRDTPPVIITLGPEATKALGINPGKILQAMGRVFDFKIKTDLGDVTYKLIPCIAMKHLAASPGLIQMVLDTLDTAITEATCVNATDGAAKFKKILQSYAAPITLSEVRALVDTIINYVPPGVHNSKPENWPLAIDTETNTLTPGSHPAPKTLMLSIAWDRGKSGTILLDHPQNPLTRGTDRTRLLAEIQRLLNCGKPKIFHNWKFDRKFLVSVYGFNVKRVAWDSMLGEHFLDEDKSGGYSLKTLTTKYCKEYAGYADELKGVNNDVYALDEHRSISYNVHGVTKWLWVSNDTNLADSQKSLDQLIEALRTKDEISQIKPADRTKEQRTTFNKLNKQIKTLAASLNAVTKLSKEQKAKATQHSDNGFSDIPLNVLRPYAAVDADVTRIIGTAQINYIKRADNDRNNPAAPPVKEDAFRMMKQLYLPASKALSEVEFTGFPVNRELLQEYKQTVTERLRAAVENIKVIFPDINLNSPVQVASAFEALKFDVVNGVTPNQTDKHALKTYLKHYSPGTAQHEFVKDLLRYRAYAKTYLSLEAYEKASHLDGRIHTSFNLAHTVTGRLSSSSPNVQNVQKIASRIVWENPDDASNPIIEFPGINLKRLFVPSRPDRVIVNCDISGAELRVFTAYSNDELMIDALTRGMDIHSVITAKVFGMEYEDVVRQKEHDPELRKKRTACKRVVFATLYGGGPEIMAQQIGTTIEEATELRDYLYKAIPSLTAYKTKIANTLRRRGGEIVTFFGRHRRFKLATIDRSQMWQAAKKAGNFPIQSTASDLVLSQLCEINDNIESLDGDILLTVHDSIVMEINRKHIGRLRQFLDYWIVTRVASKYKWLPVPFAYDAEVGPTYGDLKNLAAYTAPNS